MHGYRNVFGMWAGAGRYASGFLAILAEAGIKDVAIVTADDLFSRSVVAGAKKEAPEHGLRITTFVVEPKRHPNMTRAAMLARESGGQALILGGHFNEAVQMRLALKRMGWTPGAYYAAVGPTLQGFLDELGPDAHGAFSSSLWEPREDLPFPGSAEFLRAFRATYNEVPSYHAATAYAAGQILEQAIHAAHSLERGAVRKALYALDFTSIIGRFGVDRTGAQVRQSPIIIQWQGSERQIVWPLEMRTARPVFNR